GQRGGFHFGVSHRLVFRGGAGGKKREVGQRRKPCLQDEPVAPGRLDQFKREGCPVRAAQTLEVERQDARGGPLNPGSVEVGQRKQQVHGRCFGGGPSIVGAEPV